jgi:hypothetical protein
LEAPTPPAEQVAQRHRDARAQVYPLLQPRERAFLDRLFAAFRADAQAHPWTATLCHGDLTSDHILVEPAHPDQISGIIDFGDLCLGDPAGDFVWRYEYGESFFALVLAHYRGPRGDRAAFLRRVSYRFQLMPVIEMAYGVETGNETYIEEGRQRLRRQTDGTEGFSLGWGAAPLDGQHSARNLRSAVASKYGFSHQGKCPTPGKTTNCP